MGFIGTHQLLLILLIVLVLFGAKKVPELAKGLGAGIREFKKAARDIQQDAADPTSEISQSEKSCSTGDKES
ncbi:MAG: twin-arginine translocase TatA/TatE family subunit [Chitinispirillales bacterium]|jgi:sec-independent protein translocase protein TatA|nr:twin-arginine translocase TatA/TatE family subunit [Chitinispirillales bacterium]